MTPEQARQLLAQDGVNFSLDPANRAKLQSIAAGGIDTSQAPMAPPSLPAATPPAPTALAPGYTQEGLAQRAQITKDSRIKYAAQGLTGKALDDAVTRDVMAAGGQTVPEGGRTTIFNLRDKYGTAPLSGDEQKVIKEQAIKQADAQGLTGSQKDIFISNQIQEAGRQKYLHPDIPLAIKAPAKPMDFGQPSEPPNYVEREDLRGVRGLVNPMSGTPATTAPVPPPAPANPYPQYGLGNVLKASENQYAATQQGLNTAEQLTRKAGDEDLEKARREAHLGNIADTNLDIKESEIEANRVRRLKQSEYALNNLNAMSDQLGNYKEDPSRFFHNMNTGEKILAAIGLIFTGPVGFTVLNKLVNQDIEAQRNEYQAKANSFKAKESLYGKMMANFKDDESADYASRIMMYDSSARKIQQLALQSNVPQVKLKAQAALAKLAQDRADEAYKFAVRQYQLTHPGHAGGMTPAKVEEAAGQYSKQLQEEKIPEAESALNAVTNLLKGKDLGATIPGASRGIIGRTVQGVTDLFGGPGTYNEMNLSPEERKDYGAYREIVQNIRKLKTGVAYSPQESEDIENAIAAARTYGDLNALKDRIAEDIRVRKNAVRAGVAPQGVGLYEQRQGIYNQATQPAPALPPPKPVGQ